MTGEKSLRDFHCLGKTFFAVDKAGDFFCQTLLRRSVFRMIFHFFSECLDFLFREECEIFQILHHIAVILIEPELIEFIRRRLFRIKPYRTAGGFSEFRTVRFQHERYRQSESFRVFTSFADQVNSVRDIAPLVGAADLELDIVFFIKHFIVDGLENLVRKFGKGNARFQTGRHHIFGKHRIDIEKFSVITQKIEK